MVHILRKGSHEDAPFSVTDILDAFPNYVTELELLLVINSDPPLIKSAQY